MISSLKCLADSSPNVSKIRPCSTGGRRVARGGPAASASICLAGGSGGRRVGSRCGAACADSQRPHRRAFHRRRSGLGLCGALEFATEVVREHRPQQPHLVGAAPTTREAGHLHVLLHVAKDVSLIAAPFMIGGRAACAQALVGDDDLVLLLAAGGVGRNRSSCTGSLSCCRSRLCMKMRRALRLQLLSFQLSSKESQPSRPGMACHLRRAVGVMHIAAAVQHIKHLPRLRDGAGDCEWSLLELSPMAAFCLSGFVALQPHSCPGRRPPPAPHTPRFSRFL